MQVRHKPTSKVTEAAKRLESSDLIRGGISVAKNPRGYCGTESRLVRDLQTFLWNSRTRDYLVHLRVSDFEQVEHAIMVYNMTKIVLQYNYY